MMQLTSGGSSIGWTGMAGRVCPAGNHSGVTGTSQRRCNHPRCGQNEPCDVRRRLEAEVVSKERAVAVELPDRLAPVAFGDVGADQDSVGALPQRFTVDGGHTGFDRFSVSPGRAQLEAQYLEGVHPKLAVPLSLHQDPLVIVVRQQLTGRDHGRKIAILDRSAVKQAANPNHHLVQIDADIGRHSKMLNIRLDEPLPGPAEPPESRPKTAYRVLVG